MSVIQSAWYVLFRYSRGTQPHKRLRCIPAPEGFNFMLFGFMLFEMFRKASRSFDLKVGKLICRFSLLVRQCCNPTHNINKGEKI